MNLFIAAVFVLFCTVRSQSGSSCVTPNGERAICTSVYRCPVFLQALQNRTPTVLQFLRQSQCGYDEDPLVCCGSVANYEQRSTPPPRPFNREPGGVSQQISNRLLPSREVCGINGINNRILDGEVTALDEFPWMALLEYRSNRGRTSHSCGGMLISNRYVLTAAHCVTGQITRVVGQLYRVRLGEYNTQTDRDCVVEQGYQDCAEAHQDITVEEAIPHQDYQDGSINRYHDIALIRLSRPVQFTDFIKPICLPTNGERSNPGDKLYVAGWGLTEKEIYSPIKLKLKVPLISPQSCSNTFSRVSVRVQSGQLCAGGEEGRDSCQGDSGGPLMRTLPGDPNIWFAEGIVSFGAKCGSRDIPGIYTRISQYMDWIRQNMRQ